MSKTTDPRRFGGTGRVFGEEASQKIFNSHVTVVGMGGVGSWAVEALVRSGVGHLTLIDGDTVAFNNTNRQLHALEGNYEIPKVEAMKQRCLLINPDCRIEAVQAFVTPESVTELITPESGAVIDCIDDLIGKATLLARAHSLGLLTVCAGGAGAKLNPANITQADIARATNDPLLGKLRTILRKEYGFPAGAVNGRSKLFGIQTVWCQGPVRQPGPDTLAAIGAAPGDCVGFGSFVAVTGSVGLRLASIVLNEIAGTINA